MRRINLVLVLVIMIPFLTPVSANSDERMKSKQDDDLSLVSLSLVYPALEFYISKDEGETQFSNPSFYFNVKANISLFNKSTPTVFTFRGAGEVSNLPEWRRNFTFRFEENHIQYEVPATEFNNWMNVSHEVKFIPTVTLNTSLSFDYDLHFVFTAEYLGPGNQITGVAGATAILSVNAQIPASRLQIHTFDQGGTERPSKIEMKYSKDKPEGYSGFRTLEDVSYFSDVVPNGYYWIRAIDKETNITEIDTIFVNDSSILSLYYKIIAILPFQPLAPGNIYGDLIVNYTVVNQYKVLRDVTISIRVLNDQNQTLKNSEVSSFDAEFTTGSYTRTLNVTGIKWETGTYRIQASIFSGNTLYVEREEELTLTFFIIEEIVDSLVGNPWTPYFIFGLTGLLIGVLIMKVNNKHKKPIKTSVAEPAQSNENIEEPIEL